MFRPKKYLKLDLLKSTPSINDLEQALVHAKKLRGSTIELPWDLEAAKVSFALAVRIERDAEEALWTLYEGHGNQSHVLWSAPFNEISLLREVIDLSVAEITHTGEITSINDEAKHAPPPQPEQKSEKITPQQPEELSERKIPQEQSENKNNASNNPYNSQVNVPAQNFYPNMNPNMSGGYPALPPNFIPPMPFAYYYPGYPYPIPMPYPPGMPMMQPVANSVPLQPGMPVVDPNASSSRLPAPDADLLLKKTNFMIGQFLVESGLIPETTLKSALKLQEMVVGNVISNYQAYESINKVHFKGSNLDISQLIQNSPTSGNTSNAPKQNLSLLGDLLVRGGIITRQTLDAVLKMQEIVRAGALSKDEACQAITRELMAKAPIKKPINKPEVEKEQKIIDLLIRCSIISVKDKETALGVQKKHGGQLGQILIAAGKLHLKTYLAAAEADVLLRQERIKLEQVIIALNYCERTRLNLSDAIKELGFQN